LLVGNTYRVRPADLDDYVSARIQEQDLQATARALTDPRVWARQLDADPALKASIMSSDPAPGTFGHFLKSAAAASDSKASADNVIDLPRRKA
jgi:hypothetical protein